MTTKLRPLRWLRYQVAIYRRTLEEDKRWRNAPRYWPEWYTKLDTFDKIFFYPSIYQIVADTNALLEARSFGGGNMQWARENCPMAYGPPRVRLVGKSGKSYVKWLTRDSMYVDN